MSIYHPISDEIRIYSGREGNKMDPLLYNIAATLSKYPNTPENLLEAAIQFHGLEPVDRLPVLEQMLVNEPSGLVGEVLHNYLHLFGQVGHGGYVPGEGSGMFSFGGAPTEDLNSVLQRARKVLARQGREQDLDEAVAAATVGGWLTLEKAPADMFGVPGSDHERLFLRYLGTTGTISLGLLSRINKRDPWLLQDYRLRDYLVKHPDQLYWLSRQPVGVIGDLPYRTIQVWEMTDQAIPAVLQRILNPDLARYVGMAV